MHIRVGRVLLFLVMATASAGVSHAQSRWLLARDMPKVACLNTVQGRWHVTDDKGIHCPRDQLNEATGCCKKGQPYSCQTCSTTDGCCTEYEQCVSCCMNPKEQPQDKLKEVFRGPNREETGRWPNAFQYCRGKCRTNSHSTVHENAYLASNVYCYSAMGKPRTDEPPGPPLLAGIQLIPGQPGAACDITCQAQNASLACVEAALPSANDCNVLREHFECEAGCGMNPFLDGLPGYTVAEAEKSEQPTFCWTRPVTQNNGTMRHGCSISAPSIRRLCPCSKGSTARTNVGLPGL